MTRPRFSVLLAPLVVLMLILSACGGSTSETQTGTNASPAGEATGSGTGTSGGNQAAGSGMIEQLDFGGFGGEPTGKLQSVLAQRIERSLHLRATARLQQLQL